MIYKANWLLRILHKLNKILRKAEALWKTLFSGKEGGSNPPHRKPKGRPKASERAAQGKNRQSEPKGQERAFVEEKRKGRP